MDVQRTNTSYGKDNAIFNEHTVSCRIIVVDCVYAIGRSAYRIRVGGYH
jgi:hypothetical protein